MTEQKKSPTYTGMFLVVIAALTANDVLNAIGKIVATAIKGAQ